MTCVDGDDCSGCQWCHFHWRSRPEEDDEPCTNRYIPHEDPSLNPNPDIFTLLPNPVNIDKPFLLPTSAHLTGEDPPTKSAWQQRDLSGLPSEISEHSAAFFPPEIFSTAEFDAARRAYTKTHRCIDAKYSFLDHEQYLLHETRAQNHMRKFGSSRAEGESWSLVWMAPRDPQIIEYNRRLKQDREDDETRQKSKPHRKCEACREEDRQAADRAKILALDPWLAKELDETYGEGNWEAVPGFGIGDFRSAELRRRDDMIARAWEKMYRYEAKRMERDKFVTPFPGDRESAFKY